MVKQEDRRAAMRARLLDAAHALFLKHGYAGTTTAMILEETGVSKGAMYHHFKSKEDILAAVFADVSKAAITAASAKAARSQTAYDRLVDACLAWLAEVRKPAIAAILLKEGPRGLGWSRARDIEDENSLAAISAALEAAKADGEIEMPSVPVTARLINALLAEAAFIGLEGEAASRKASEAALRRFFNSLRPAKA